VTDKLPPEVHEKLAETLRSKLQKQRLRPGRWFLAALAFIAILAAGVRWGMRPEPSPLPPVMLVCFDALAMGDRADVAAQLIAPGHPDAKLLGHRIYWGIHRNGEVVPNASQTDAAGQTYVTVEMSKEKSPIIALASFVDPRGAFRRDDRALVAAAGARPVEAIAIEDLVDAPNRNWLSGDRQVLKPSVSLDRSKMTVYCAGAVDPATYRAMRLWLQRQFAESSLPAGPLLRETPPDLTARLTQRE
jgi:hypothetical protein